VGPVGNNKWLVCLSASKYHVINALNVREDAFADFQATVEDGEEFDPALAGRWVVATQLDKANEVVLKEGTFINLETYVHGSFTTRIPAYVFNRDTGLLSVVAE
jgi:hypothetical protein